jgi:triphosphatase
METELKLTTSPAHLHKISAQRLLQDFATQEPSTHRLVSHYFDTPDSALSRRGLTLRVREDAQHSTQTLKDLHDGAATGGTLQRGEWETPVPSATPDVRGLLKANHLPRKVSKTLRRASRAGTLAERFTVEAERTTWTLDVDGATIEMALDAGTLHANGAHSTFSEIELERKSGKKAALYKAAHQLAHHIPVQLSFVTKAERGFALLGDGPRPRKASAIAFPRGASVEQGMRRILAGCLTHAQANAQGFLDSDDPEYLHQLRVGMRRFKSALKLFRDLVALPPDLQRQLDDLSTLLGAARDADVLLLTTSPHIARAGRHADFLQPLLARAQAHASDKRAAARLAVHSTHHAQMMIDLFAWVDGKGWRKEMARTVRARLRKPLSGFARQAVIDAHAVVARRVRKVRKLGGHESASLHRLRIGCKQARYAVEFFEGIERPDQARRYIKQLSAVQEALGKLNDAHVAQTTLAVLTQDQPALAPQAGVVAAYLNGMATAGVASGQGAWRKLARPAAARGVRGLQRRSIMELILWRHAEAEEGHPDLARALTPKGRRQAQKMAEWIKGQLPGSVRIVASPAVRTRQTADALDLPYEILPQIDPAANANDLLKATGWPDGHGVVILVGHNPSISVLASRLAGAEESSVVLRRAAAWWYDSNGGADGTQPHITLKTVMTPSLLAPE